MSRHNQFFRLRASYLLALGVIVVLGLLSRRMAWLPNSAGDMFWAMMVFCIIRLVFVRWRNMSVGAGALIISFFVEFSQLIQWGWLCRFRSTLVGHLLLGQGFMWEDLVAYFVGVILMLILGIITHK